MHSSLTHFWASGIGFSWKCRHLSTGVCFIINAAQLYSQWYLQGSSVHSKQTPTRQAAEPPTASARIPAAWVGALDFRKKAQQPFQLKMFSTNQMQINTCRIVFTRVDYAVINVLVTCQSCISWVAQTIEAIDNCNRHSILVLKGFQNNS